METIREKKKEELRHQLRQMEEKREDIRRQADQALKEEEEQDWQGRETYLMWEQMRESCVPEEREILQIIDEGQNTLNAMRKYRTEFMEEFRNEIQKKNREIDMNMEEIYHQMQEIQNEKNN